MNDKLYKDGDTSSHMNLKQEVIENIFALRRQDLFRMLCDGEPPLNLCYSDDITTDEEQLELSDWVGMHLKERVGYSTGTDLIEAVWMIADSDFRNGSPHFPLYLDEIKESEDAKL